MLRTALGSDIITFLEDPSVVEVILNPDLGSPILSAQNQGRPTPRRGPLHAGLQARPSSMARSIAAP
jgi:hypothetical protein